jgi:putative transposase
VPDNRLSVGTHFRENGQEYVIEGPLPSGELQVKNIVTEVYGARTVESILHGVCYENLEIVGEDQNLPFLKEKLQSSQASDLTILDREENGEARKREAYRREHYVRAVIDERLTSFTQRSLAPVIEAVGRKIRDPSMPSWRSVYRWYKDYMAAGQDLRALVPAWNQRGNRAPKSSGTRLEKYEDADKAKAGLVTAIMQKVVNTEYLRRPAPKIASVYRTLEARILEYNRHREENDQIPVPHINTLYNYVATLDEYEKDVAHKSKSFVNQKWRVNKQGPRPTRPLEMTQADHTRADLMVLDPLAKIPLGRPWITLLMDVFTKLILGLYVGFTKPSATSVMYCLRHAIRPKTYVGKVFPEIENTWDSYGIPEQVTVDNGKEFYSTTFKDACSQLRMKVHYAPRRSPQCKGGVETMFGTINSQLLHELPGTTLSNIFQRGDYDPKKHAVIRLDHFVQMLHVYIVDIYHQDVHGGIIDIPARRWRESIKECIPNIPSRKEDLEVLLGHTEERSIDSSGVEFKTLYNSKELGLIRRQLKPGEQALVKVDVDDLSFIYVRDRMNDRFLPVPALDQEYTKGLTLWQHLVIMKFRRKSAELLKDRDGLARTKLRLQGMVDKAMGTSKLLAGREKIARYLNLGMPNYAKLMRGEDEDCAPDGSGEVAPARNGGTIHLMGISAPPRAGGEGGATDGECISDASQYEAVTACISEYVEDPPAEAKRARGSERARSGADKNGLGRNGGGKKSATGGTKNKPGKAASVEGDDDLDESGWDSDYSLPV